LLPLFPSSATPSVAAAPAPASAEPATGPAVPQSAAAARLARSFPLAAVVGCDFIKEALLLGAVDSALGGVCIAGRRGTAKSVLARGVHALLPPIEVAAASYCNANPDKRGEWEDGLAARLGGKEPERAIRDAPFVQIPLGVTEDRLVGTVDIEASMKEGRTVFQPGLLAEAHRGGCGWQGASESSAPDGEGPPTLPPPPPPPGVLYVDEINLLDESIANLLLSVISDGWNVVEREGLSVRHPCRPLLIATFNPEEGPLREHLLDRIAITLSADVPPKFDDRVRAVATALEFQDSPATVQAGVDDATEALKTQVLFAREYLKEVTIGDKQVERLAGEAARGGVQGHRGELFAARVAMASAALDGRDTVSADDVAKAVQLVILPRATTTGPPPDDDDQQPPPPPPPPPPQHQDQDQDQEEQEEENEEEEPPEEEEDQARGGASGRVVGRAHACPTFVSTPTTPTSLPHSPTKCRKSLSSTPTAPSSTRTSCGSRRPNSAPWAGPAAPNPSSSPRTGGATSSPCCPRATK
jgi:magnesium chelatase subunit D